VQRPGWRLSSHASVATLIAGVAAVALASGIPNSPLSPELPPGAGAIAPLRAAAKAARLDAISPDAQAAVCVAALLVCTAAFLFALREAWLGRLSLRLVVGLGTAFIVVSTVMPLLLSTDVYSYALYGRMSSIHHVNPYIAVPNDFRSDPLFPWTAQIWRDTPAVYGPSFIALASLLTGVVRGTASLVWTFKLVAGVATIGILLLVARTSQRLWPSRAAFAAALIGWNPVVLFHGVAGGHNDTLVALAVVGAFALLGDASHIAAPVGRLGTGRDKARMHSHWQREMLAVVVLTLGALVKAAAAVPLALLLTATVWSRHRGGRLRTAILNLATVLAVIAVFVGLFFQTRNPTFGLATAATPQHGWVAPTRFFLVPLGRLGHSIGGQNLESWVEVLVRVAFAATFGAVLALLIRDTARRATSESLNILAYGIGWGWGLLLLLLLAPALLPWYALLVLPLVWMLPRSARLGSVVLGSLLMASYTLADPGLFPRLYQPIRVFTFLLTAATFLMLVWLLRDLLRYLRVEDPDRPRLEAVDEFALGRGAQRSAHGEAEGDG
jgi:alpha-1,6-mannosyltransferase